MDPSEAKQKLAEKYRLYHEVFTSPNGQEVLKDLELIFSTTGLKKCADGTIDPTSVIAAAGQREVILYIHHMRDHYALD